jgi:hypothetical protein
MPKVILISEPLVRIGYDATLNDLVAYARYHFYHTPGLRRRRAIAIGVLALWMLEAGLR